MQITDNGNQYFCKHQQIELDNSCTTIKGEQKLNIKALNMNAKLNSLEYSPESPNTPSEDGH